MLWPYLKPGGTFFIEDLSDYGAGERPGGRFGSPMVATRRLLKHYARTGELLEPHAFENPDFLSDVESIMFYCPRALLRPRDLAVEAIRLLTGRSHRGVIRPEWAADSEMLVALRRRA